MSLAPVVAIGGDCPVVGGGGYTGFEHYLYRIEIADDGSERRASSGRSGTAAWRGAADSTPPRRQPKVFIDAGRAAIVNSGLVEFYLEALQYDELAGTWVVVYGAMATLNSDHDLELTAPPVFGALPSTTDPVFFRLWNGIAEVASFTSAAPPNELRDGIRLVFDAPGAGNYRPGDYWTFTVRAGEITNPAVLVDHAPPVGIVYHRVALAEINWTGRQDTGRRLDRGLPPSLPAAHESESLLHAPRRRRGDQLRRLQRAGGGGRAPAGRGRRALSAAGPAPRQPGPRRPPQRHHSRLSAAHAGPAADRDQDVTNHPDRRLRRE